MCSILLWQIQWCLRWDSQSRKNYIRSKRNRKTETSINRETLEIQAWYGRRFRNAHTFRLNRSKQGWWEVP
jgi:hypothetical protein